MRDLPLILIGTLCCLGAIAYGAKAAADDQTARDQSARSTNSRVLGSNVAGALPPGIRVDPATGLMVGVRIQASKGVTPVPWELLRSYEYDSQQGLVDVPQPVADLDGKRIAMLGFLWTMYEYDDIDEFGLVGNHWSCCYGIPPGLSDVVVVTLREDQAGLSQTLNPIRVEGTLHVREIKDGGFTVAIYEMTDAVATVLEY